MLKHIILLGLATTATDCDYSFGINRVPAYVNMQKETARREELSYCMYNIAKLAIRYLYRLAVEVIDANRVIARVHGAICLHRYVDLIKSRIIPISARQQRPDV